MQQGDPIPEDPHMKQKLNIVFGLITFMGTAFCIGPFGIALTDLPIRRSIAGLELIFITGGTISMMVGASLLGFVDRSKPASQDIFSKSRINPRP